MADETTGTEAATEPEKPKRKRAPRKKKAANKPAERKPAERKPAHKAESVPEEADTIEHKGQTLRRVDRSELEKKANDDINAMTDAEVVDEIAEMLDADLTSETAPKKTLDDVVSKHAGERKRGPPVTRRE